MNVRTGWYIDLLKTMQPEPSTDSQMAERDVNVLWTMPQHRQPMKQPEPDSDSQMMERDSVGDFFDAPDPEPEDTRPQQLQRALYGPRTVRTGMPLLGDHWA